MLTLLLLLAFGTACGASTANTAPPVVRDVSADDPADDPTDHPDDEPRIVVSGRQLEGPFADWTAICGEPTEHEGRYARCWTQVEALGGGPFEKIATYHEGDPGSALFALKTAEGWYVPELPDGRPLFGGRSHHTPGGASVDAASSHYVRGVLELVVRGSQNSYIPGRGAFGATSLRWTRVHQCQANDSGVVCDEGEIIWQERCQSSEQPETVGPDTPGPSRTCEETGTDIARAND